MFRLYALVALIFVGGIHQHTAYAEPLSPYRDPIVIKIVPLNYIVANTASAWQLAWWLTVDFRAKGTSIEGLPIEDIDPSWKYATVLSRDKIPKEVLDSDPLDPMTEYNYRFVIEKDINRDGSPEKILTGVFEAKDGTRGRFLLILEFVKKSWRKAFLQIDGEKAGFSILNETREGVVFWTFCMECGMAGYIKWDGTNYYLEWANKDYG
jgi:hypothetical protein